jgi:hypothetical protein
MISLATTPRATLPRSSTFADHRFIKSHFIDAVLSFIAAFSHLSFSSVLDTGFSRNDDDKHFSLISQ